LYDVHARNGALTTRKTMKAAAVNLSTTKSYCFKYRKTSPEHLLERDCYKTK
jgi:hypothetical protein